MSVKDLVTASQAPLLVKTGVRSWKARSVPVGRRLARLAVEARVCESARCRRVDGADDDGDGGGDNDE